MAASPQSTIYKANELPLMLGRPEVQKLIGCGINSAIDLMKRGEEEGYYVLARLGQGKNARYKVHRDAFLGFLCKDESYRN